jgi:hypothetical protein
MQLENRMPESDTFIFGHNTMYPSEWFWRNAQCISQNRTGERMHRLPSQNVTCGSESDRFDIAGGVARSSGEILVLSVRDVKMGLGVTELLGETEIDDLDLIFTLSNAYEEVVRFDIVMNEVSRVDIFDDVGGRGTCHSSLPIPQRNVLEAADFL